MKLEEVAEDEIVKLRDSYRLELRRETQATPDGGARTVLDATKMTRPGDKPLA